MNRRHFLQSISLVALAAYSCSDALLGQADALSLQAGELAPVLNQINALRTDPANSQATLDKMVVAAFPDAAERAKLLTEKYGEKTHTEHLAELVAFLKDKPKLAPLQWDAGLAEASARGGKSMNALFTPEHTFDTFDKAPAKALLWTLLRGVDFHYVPLFGPGLRFCGIAPKGDDLQITVSALKGTAFNLSDEAIGKNAYDPRLDKEPAWVFALFLKEPNIIPFAKADGSMDVAWREMGSKQVFVSRIGADGAFRSTKQVGGVQSSEHSLLAGFTEDPQGNLYVARSMDVPPPADDVNTPKENPGNAYDHPDIVKLTKLDKDANEVWTKNFAMKGGSACAFFSPLSSDGKGTHGATSKIACSSVKRPVYKLAGDESIVVPPQVAEQCLLGFSINRMGVKSSSHFEPRFQPSEAGGILSSKVKLQFDENWIKGTVFAAASEPGKPATFHDGGSVSSYSELGYAEASYAKFQGFIEANKQGVGKEQFVPVEKLKLTLTIEKVPLVFLIYGAATDYDPAIKGRHQNAYWRTLDARTGEPVEDFNGGAMAHSFDARVLVTDEGVITAERSDGFLLMSNYLQTRPGPIFLAAFNTVSDINESFSQIGGLAPADDGYLLLYAANNYSKDVTFNRDDGLTDAQALEESLRQRDIGVLRAKKGFAQEIDGWQDRDKKVFKELLDSRKKPAESDPLFHVRPKYITSYHRDNQPYSAGRPKIVRVADGNFVVFWERWTHNVAKNAEGKRELSGDYDSTWAMNIDKNGAPLLAPRKISDTLRLLRGDDPVAWSGKAAFVTGDAVEGRLVLHTIDAQLNYQAASLPLR